MFNRIYEGRTVLVTGHTGFKGSWLVAWLERLGAHVVGLSDGVLDGRSHFEDLAVNDLEQHWVDVRDAASIRQVVADVRPDVVFHLAAQPLVTQSYDAPLETFDVNVMGTANVLDALRILDKPCAAIMVTSDKCYENTNTFYGYRETDPMGGADPYSASKGAAELVVASFIRSFFPDESSVRVATVRSGNVIGGGDWAANRLVPDVVRSWERNEAVVLRNPSATRPWQHVLEPLAGYLHLASKLMTEPEFHGEAFNFGPQTTAVRTVREVVGGLADRFDGLSVEVDGDGWAHEAAKLGLNCDKARALLGWEALLPFDETLSMTSDWYASYVGSGPVSATSMTMAQIEHYEKVGSASLAEWVEAAA